MKEEQIRERFQRIEEWMRKNNYQSQLFVDIQKVNQKRIELTEARISNIEKRGQFYLELENKIRKHWWYRLLFWVKKVADKKTEPLPTDDFLSLENVQQVMNEKQKLSSE